MLEDGAVRSSHGVANGKRRKVVADHRDAFTRLFHPPKSSKTAAEDLVADAGSDAVANDLGTCFECAWDAETSAAARAAWRLNSRSPRR